MSAANTNDHQALTTMVSAIPRIRTRGGRRRFRPDKLHADKAYDVRDLRRWLTERGIIVRVSRKGVDTSERLGRHRWVIERTIAWLTGRRRLTIRYETKATHYLAFVTLAAALTCWNKLTK
ncbi:IS5 family transposase [Actinokineospora sp. NBRC 105648]|nr:IS5 family transposase [Actinokineospora sp. NBRC 105648]